MRSLDALGDLASPRKDLGRKAVHSDLHFRKIPVSTKGKQ